MDGPHVICSGPVFGEGPVWCPPGAGSTEGTLVVHQLGRGQPLPRLAGVGPPGGDRRHRRVVPTVPRSAADGGFVVTQNGGIDFSIFELFGDTARPDYVQSGLQRVAPDGTVSYLTPGRRCRCPTTCASRPTAPSTSPTRSGRRPTRRAGTCSRWIPTATLPRRRRGVLGTERHRARHRRRDAHRGGERPQRRGRRLRPPPARRHARDVRAGPDGRRLRARRRRSDLHGRWWTRDHGVRTRRHGGRAGRVPGRPSGQHELLLRGRRPAHAVRRRRRCSRTRVLLDRPPDPGRALPPWPGPGV